MKLEKVSSSVWAVTDGSTYGNVGCIKLEDGIVVIDSAVSPSIAEQFLELIHEHVGPKISDVIITHYHSDHTFGAQKFKGSRIIASAATTALYPELLKESWSPTQIKARAMEMAKTDPTWAGMFDDLNIITPVHTFDQSMALGPNDEIIITHTGGHTVGQSIVFFQPERILFASDLIFCQEFPYAGDPTNDPRQWMNIFREILDMSVERIVPGHGPICGKEEVEKHLTYFEELEAWLLEKIAANVKLEAVLEVLNEGPSPPYEVKTERRLEGSIRRWYEYFKDLGD